MSQNISIFKKQQALLRSNKPAQPLKQEFSITTDTTYLHTSTPLFAEFEKRHADLEASLRQGADVTFEDANAILSDIRANWEQERLNDLLKKCRIQIINSIVGPFGLGSIVASYDKLGGNITTTHNSKKGTYAREDIEGFKRDDYTGAGTKYNHSSSEYRDDKIDINFDIRDEYTGKKLYYKGKDNRSSVDVDHVISTKKYHKEGGFTQNSDQRGDFASDKRNFAVTDRSINRSMQDKDIESWANEQHSTEKSKTNAEYYDIDMQEVKKIVERAKSATQTHAPTKTDWAKYYTERLAITGTKEAAKMGLQQALGLLISELFESLFLEIKDSYVNGFTRGVDQNSFLSALRIRAIRIIDNLLIKWKNIAIAFRDGSISGILSNILTTFINTFLTTTKRLIRIIREGFFGILQATKLIFLRPKGMSASEAADAALKLLTATVFTGIGIIAEESLAKFIGTIPYSEIIIPALIGGLVGISSSIVVYMLDKLDLFGVHEKKAHQLTITQLQRQIYIIDQNITTLYDEAMNPF